MMYIFTDGSVNPKSGIGFGAYLAIPGVSESLDSLNEQINIKRFEQSSPTKLELQTLLWALSEIPDNKIIAYTDSKNITGLLTRKKRLLGSGYRSKKGKLLKNHALYRKFFKTIEPLDIQFCFIEGHKPSRHKDQIDKIFSIVDRASRNALRMYMNVLKYELPDD